MSIAGIRTIIALVILCVVSSVSSLSMAGESSDPAAQQAFAAQLKKVGITYEQSGLNVNIFLDQDIALAAVPTLQALGAMNTQLSTTDINAHPLMYSGVVTMYFMSVILPFIYTNSQNSFIHVTVYLLSPNDYGNTQKREIIAFDFTRDLFQKINWDKLQPESLMKIAPGFKLSHWYEEALRNE